MREPHVPDVAAAPEPCTALGVLDAVHEVMGELEAVGTALGAGEARAAERLEAATEKLHAVEEQVASADAARRDERLGTGRLLAALPVPVLTTDTDGTILDANAAAAGLLGVDLPSLPRTSWFAFLETRSCRRGRSLLGGAARTGRPAEGVLDVRPRGGPASPCRVLLAPIPAADAVRWVVEAPRAAGDDPASQASLVELCGLGAGDADLDNLLRRVSELACDGLSGVAGASVLLGDPLAPDVLVSSSSFAQHGDGAQHRAGSGPIVDAHARTSAVGTADLFGDDRWPRLRGPVGRRPGRGCLALPLVLGGETIGVLALYECGSHLDAALATRARPYAAAAQTLVRDSRLLAELADARRQLESALVSRAVIDQAKGIVMLTRACTADEAFALLVRMSNSGNRRLRDIAADVVDRASRGELALQRP